MWCKYGTNRYIELCIECSCEAKISEAIECILCLFFIKTLLISCLIYHQYGEKETVNDGLLLADTPCVMTGVLSHITVCNHKNGCLTGTAGQVDHDSVVSVHIIKGCGEMGL